jgi:hypothetical protein
MKKIPTFTLVRRVSLTSQIAAPARPTEASGSGRQKSTAAKGDGDTETVARKSSSGQLKPARKPDSTLKSTATKAAEKSNSSFATDSRLQFTDRAVRKALSTTRLKDTYMSLDANFKEALRNSLTSQVLRQDGRVRSVEVSQNLKAITEDLARGERVLRVGVLDFGTYMAGLPTLMERLNKAQSMFTLFDIMTALPSGLVKNPKGFRDWVRAKNEGSLRKLKVAGALPQLIFDDFYTVAENIRKGMGLDIFVCLTPYRVAGLDNDGKPYWDHFGCTLGNVILVSTDDLRRYAAEANRPFEVGAGMLLVASLFTSVNEDLDYHRVDTGCIFDYNDDRDTLKTCIVNLTIDDHCLAMMTSEEAKAAKGMLIAMKRMRRRKEE